MLIMRERRITTSSSYFSLALVGSNKNSTISLNKRKLKYYCNGICFTKFLENHISEYFAD